MGPVAGPEAAAVRPDGYGGKLAHSTIVARERMRLAVRRIQP